MHRPIDRLLQLASKNICDGAREEPRLYFDRIPLDLETLGSNGINGDPMAFQNGEQYPVRLTKLIASVGLEYIAGVNAVQLSPALTQSVIQGIGMRIRRSDEYYMNANMIAIPTWMNTVSNSPFAFGNGGVSWTFDRPVVLSVRDHMEVDVQCLMDLIIGEEGNMGFSATISVSYTGVGLLSKQPYFLSGEKTVTDSKPIKINANDLQNVSSEPIALTDFSAQVRIDSIAGGQIEAVSQLLPNDIRFVAIQMRQLQNGTRTKWLQGPTVPTPLGRANGGLLGLTSGPSIVHTFPGEGIQLEPGDALRIDAIVQAVPQQLAFTNPNIQLNLGLAGYVMVV